MLSSKLISGNFEDTVQDVLNTPLAEMVILHLKYGTLHSHLSVFEPFG